MSDECVALFGMILLTSAHVARGVIDMGQINISLTLLK